MGAKQTLSLGCCAHAPGVLSTGQPLNLWADATILTAAIHISDTMLLTFDFGKAISSCRAVL